MAAPHEFYTPEQVAQVLVEMTSDETLLASLISRDFQDDLFGGGGKGRTVNLKVPSALIARERDIDEVTDAIVLDSLKEKTVPLTLGTHVYNAVGLGEGDLNLDIANYSRQVLKPQSEAVVDYIENLVAETLLAEALTPGITFDPASPVKAFTQLRATLRKRGVPATGLNVLVGVDVYAACLDAKAIDDASQSGSTSALRDANVGRLRGFTIVETTRIPDDEIIAFHRNAFTLATRAPQVPAGASFGTTIAEKGFSLRYLRDYDAMHTQDRSIVSTFAGVAKMPLYKVSRNYTTGVATVDAQAAGAVMRIGTAAGV